MYFAVYISIILIKICNCETDENYKIESLPAGLYYSEIGLAHVSKGEYELYHYYNISDILIEKSALIILQSDTIKHIPNNTCNTRNNILCIIDHNIEKILNQIEFVLDLCDKSDNTLLERVKRGLFGKFLTYVFGVNDEAYAALNELQLQNKDLLIFTKNINNIFQKKLQETQAVIQKKVTVMADEMRNETLGFYEILLEHQILENVRNIEYKLNKIINAINAKGDWYDHFLYKSIKEIINKANAILKNEVSFCLVNDLK